MRNFIRKIREKIRLVNYEIAESGLRIPFLLMLSLAIIVIALDIIFWNEEFLTGIIAEGNGMLLDLILVVTLLGYFEFRRNKRNELITIRRELNILRRSKNEEDVLKKGDLIRYINKRKVKFTDLKHFFFDGIVLPDSDFSGLNMRFCSFAKAKIPLCKFRKTDLFEVNFQNSILIQSDFTDAYLYEADFSGAELNRVIFNGADLTHVNFLGAQNLTQDQLMSGKNWENSYRDPTLACGKPIPDPNKLSLAHQFRKAFRNGGNPMYPYQFVKIHNLDGTIETIVEKNDDYKEEEW
jgi:BTB/POZ domain-containing protein KCTD9